MNVIDFDVSAKIGDSAGKFVQIFECYPFDWFLVYRKMGRYYL